MELMWRVSVYALEKWAPQVQEKAVWPALEACFSRSDLSEETNGQTAQMLLRKSTLPCAVGVGNRTKLGWPRCWS